MTTHVCDILLESLHAAGCRVFARGQRQIGWAELPAPTPATGTLAVVCRWPSGAEVAWHFDASEGAAGMERALAGLLAAPQR